jgi:hypothetical protein
MQEHSNSLNTNKVLSLMEINNNYQQVRIKLVELELLMELYNLNKLKIVYYLIQIVCSLNLLIKLVILVHLQI